MGGGLCLAIWYIRIILSNLSLACSILLVGHKDLTLVARATNDDSVAWVSVVEEWLSCCGLLSTVAVVGGVSTPIVTHDAALLRDITEIVGLVPSHQRTSS
jgi:hypothetical protein